MSQATSITAPRSPSREAAQRILWIALLVTAAVAALAWSTPLRDILYAGLIAVCIFAFLPFIIIVTFVAALLLLCMLAGDATFEASHVHAWQRGSAWLVRSYYGFLARHRHSAWLGIPVGVFFGTLIIWGMLAVFVIPRELRTAERLLEARVEIDRYYEQHKDYPEPRQRGYVSPATGAALRDDFDRQVDYIVQGHWRLKSYRLLSYGADGVLSDDDLCTSGHTKLQEAINLSALLTSIAELATLKGKTPVGDRLATLSGVRCEHQELRQSD